MSELDGRGETMHWSFSADLESVAELRERVRRQLVDRGVAATRADEIRLAIGELGSNAVLHSDDDTIEVAVAVAEDHLTLEMSGAPPPDRLDVDAPPPDQFSGRGLLIVRAVAESIDVADHDGVSVIRCRFALGTP